MKTTTKLIAISLVAATAVAGSMAIAQERGGKNMRGERLEQLDTNKDGAISRDEVKAERLERFAMADIDSDGAVSQAEMVAFTEARRAERRERRQARQFARLDTDGNGTVSAEEFAGREMKMFERADINGDGSVDAEEREAMAAKVRDMRGKHRGKRADRMQ